MYYLVNDGVGIAIDNILRSRLLKQDGEGKCEQLMIGKRMLNDEQGTKMINQILRNIRVREHIEINIILPIQICIGGFTLYMSITLKNSNVLWNSRDKKPLSRFNNKYFRFSSNTTMECSEERDFQHFFFDFVVLDTQHCRNKVHKIYLCQQV